MEKRKKIALLIDYDNFQQDAYFPILFEELNLIGDIILKKAYYSNLNDGSLKEKFVKFGIEPMSQLAYSTRKNAVDIRITIEAMELLNRDYIDAICLATNDSDFTPLIKRLQENNRYVIGAGDNHAAVHFKSACNLFISVEKIQQNSPDNQKGKKNPKELSTEINELVDVVNNIIDSLNGDGDYALFPAMMQVLYNRVTDFNPKNYGAKNSKPLSFFQTILSKYYEIKTIDGNVQIKIKKQS